MTAGCRRIGIGSVVAACSVVTRDVDDFAIVGGNPARLIRYRFPRDVIDRIIASGWWELPVDACIAHLSSMVRPLQSVANHPLMPSQLNPVPLAEACA